MIIADRPAALTDLRIEHGGVADRRPGLAGGHRLARPGRPRPRGRACRCSRSWSGSTGRSSGDLDRDRGPHAAARGLRRHLRRRRPTRSGSARTSTTTRSCTRRRTRGSTAPSSTSAGSSRAWPRTTPPCPGDARPDGPAAPTASTPDDDGGLPAQRLAAARPHRRQDDAASGATSATRASWTVIREIAEDAGDDGMRAVFAAATDATIPYVGDRAAETAGRRTDWRQFLDLVQEVGGAEGADDAVPDLGRAAVGDRRSRCASRRPRRVPRARRRRWRMGCRRTSSASALVVGIRRGDRRR